eukprot:366406-Chlamydomonas_euryale.AAC.32
MECVIRVPLPHVKGGPGYVACGKVLDDHTVIRHLATALEVVCLHEHTAKLTISGVDCYFPIPLMDWIARPCANPLNDACQGERPKPQYLCAGYQRPRTYVFVQALVT